MGGRRQYRTLLSGELVWLHPSSSLFLQQPQPEAVIYSELVFTSRKYIRCVTSIELHWLLELAPQCFRQDTRGGAGRENQLTHMTGYTSRGFYTSREARDNESASNIPQLTRKRQRRR